MPVTGNRVAQREGQGQHCCVGKCYWLQCSNVPVGFRNKSPAAVISCTEGGTLGFVPRMQILPVQSLRCIMAARSHIRWAFFTRMGHKCATLILHCWEIGMEHTKIWQPAKKLPTIVFLVRYVILFSKSFPGSFIWNLPVLFILF